MSDASSRRVARQLLETDILLGLDQVVRGSMPADSLEPDLRLDFKTETNTDESVAEASAVHDERPTTAPVARSKPAVSPLRSSDSSGEVVDHPLQGGADERKQSRLNLPFSIGELGEGDPEQKLAELASRHASECRHCTGAKDYTNLVFGEGSARAELMFVGEAPGATEDRLGRPFVGLAGEKLDDMIKAMGMAREDVYIANVLKSRPPNNRTPMRDESDACGQWLAAQIAVVRPSVLVALGGPAAKLLLGTEVGITRLRGIWGAVLVDDCQIPVMPTYHPAYVLRQYTPQVRGEVWNDLQLVMARLKSSGR